MSIIKANRIENLTTTNGGIDINNSGNVGIGKSPNEALDVSGNVELSGQLHQSMPSDFWSQGNTFIECNGMGNLTHMGGYETCLTSNGYRDLNAQWKSYAINGTTGASQIRVNPNGYIAFGAESSKSDGDSHTVTERMRILSSGGITFNGDTATANALDDYEEGTFTPGYNSALASPSYSVQSGHYTKVGRCVTFTLTLNATGINTGDQLLILGLPFTASSTLENGGATINYFSGNSGNLTQYAHIGKNVNYISFYLGSGFSWVGVSGDGVSGKTFHLNGFYYV